MVHQVNILTHANQGPFAHLGTQAGNAPPPNTVINRSPGPGKYRPLTYAPVQHDSGCRLINHLLLADTLSSSCHVYK